MNWIIRKINEHVYEVSDRGDVKVRMINISHTIAGAAEHWTVTFLDAPSFNWDATSIDRAIGYVRGIERAAQVHAKETRAPRRRAS